MKDMTAPEVAYLHASEIRGFLEEKTRVGTEGRVFGVAGDFFLDAMEADCAKLGPWSFRDYYSGMLGCYREGDRPNRLVEGTLYSVDLLLQRSVYLFLEKDSLQQTSPEDLLSFQTPHDTSYQALLGEFLGLAERSLKDTVDAITRRRGYKPTATFLDHAIELKARVEGVLYRWRRFCADPAATTCSNEEFLVKGLDLATDCEYRPLMALLSALLAALRERAKAPKQEELALEEVVHPFYEAGALYVDQANEDRECEAYSLAHRRYLRAIDLFRRINDRTSTAKALVEMARALIKSEEDPQALSESLHEAARLVVAHMRGFPHGKLPTLGEDDVVRFLDSKGYAVEARAYEKALKWQSALRE